MTRARCLIGCLAVVLVGFGGHASVAAEELPSCGPASETRLASVVSLAFRQPTNGGLTRMALGFQPDDRGLTVPTGRNVWGLRYDAADRSASLLVILDASTGEVILVR